MISVVIPARAEGVRLLAAIEAITRLGGEGEIVVAAHDESSVVRNRARRCSRLVWVDCPRASRGEQLARGAAAAAGDVLLFLHADTRLPTEAQPAIAAALRDPRVLGGGFRLAFDARHPALDLLAGLSAVPWRFAYLGDQGFFVRRDAYHAIGGYRPLPLFEDMDLARRLARHGRLVRLACASRTSARRFLAAGPWRQLALNARLVGLFMAGADPLRLAKRYRP